MFITVCFVCVCCEHVFAMAHMQSSDNNFQEAGCSFSSTTWAPRVEVRWSGLVAGIFARANFLGPHLTTEGQIAGEYHSASKTKGTILSRWGHRAHTQ